MLSQGSAGKDGQAILPLNTSMRGEPHQGYGRMLCMGSPALSAASLGAPWPGQGNGGPQPTLNGQQHKCLCGNPAQDPRAIAWRPSAASRWLKKPQAAAMEMGFQLRNPYVQPENACVSRHTDSLVSNKGSLHAIPTLSQARKRVWTANNFHKLLSS